MRRGVILLLVLVVVLMLGQLAAAQDGLPDRPGIAQYTKMQSCHQF